MTPRKLKTDPEIVEMLPRKMAVVRATGTPSEVLPKALPGLHGSVYALHFERKKQGLAVFKVSGLRARYPDPPETPQEQWSIAVGLPVPDDTTALPKKEAGPGITLETWQYGTVAQILHLGDYAQEEGSIARLQQFITDEGYRVSGVHEEEYLTRPDAKTPKTIIRYPVVRQNKD